MNRRAFSVSNYFTSCAQTRQSARSRPIAFGKKMETLPFSGCLTGYAGLASGVLDFNQIAVATGNQVNTNVIINK
jgi:hypothetical protein